MKTIILNHYYPHLTERVMLEVSDEIAVALSIGGRLCDSYKRRKREHDECSLDSTPGFEADVTFPPPTPERVMETTENRAALYAANIDKVLEIADKITGICREPLCFETILQKLFADYGLTMNFEQYVLVGSTVRSYLTWLKDTGRINGLFENNMLLWQRV